MHKKIGSFELFPSKTNSGLYSQLTSKCPTKGTFVGIDKKIIEIKSYLLAFFSIF